MWIFKKYTVFGHTVQIFKNTLYLVIQCEFLMNTLYSIIQCEFCKNTLYSVIQCRFLKEYTIFGHTMWIFKKIHYIRSYGVDFERIHYIRSYSVDFWIHCIRSYSADFWENTLYSVIYCRFWRYTTLGHTIWILKDILHSVVQYGYFWKCTIFLTYSTDLRIYYIRTYSMILKVWL